MLPMTNKLRKKIQMFIKNRKDISDLIKNVDIRGEKLEYAIIKNFTRVNSDISEVKLSNAIIGEENKITNISGNKMHNCDFSDVKFLGKIFMRRCDCTNSDFSNAWMPYVEHQNTIFYDCKFCETFFRLGTAYSLGAKFNNSLFQDLSKFWNVQIIPKK